MLSDLRFAFRQLSKSPGFTIVAVLTLALGIGANTAIFSMINAALLRPLPFPEPEQLVELRAKTVDGNRRAGGVSGATYKELRDRATMFESISIYRSVAFNLIDRGKAERIGGLEVTSSFLPTLRVNPLHGRTFEPGEDEIGHDNHVVILTHEWWQTRFGGDPAIVGSAINLNLTPYTVIGVLAPAPWYRSRLNFSCRCCSMMVRGKPIPTSPGPGWPLVSSAV